jgi:hypothetical protein
MRLLDRFHAADVRIATGRNRGEDIKPGFVRRIRPFNIFVIEDKSDVGIIYVIRQGVIKQP